MSRIGAAAIIVNEKNEVLLNHRTDFDLWDLPWWCVEPWETPRDAVIREVKEETGLDVQIKELLGIYSKTDEDALTFQFIVEIIGWATTVSDEASEIVFFDKDALPKNTLPKHIERIKDYFSDSKRPILKEQKGKSTIQLIKEGKL